MLATYRGARLQRGVLPIATKHTRTRWARWKMLRMTTYRECTWRTPVRTSQFEAMSKFDVEICANSKRSLNAKREAQARQAWAPPSNGRPQHPSR